MTMRFRFERVAATQGDEVVLNHAGVTCIVGANNAGKSQLLRDLLESARNGAQAQMVVLSSSSYSLEVGSDLEAGEWLERHAVPAEHPSIPPSFAFLPSQNQVTKDMFAQQVRHSSQNEWGLGGVDEAFVRRIPAGALAAFAAGELRTEASPDSQRNWLLRRLYSDGELERELSGLVEELFATPVFLDRQNFPPRLRAGVSEFPLPAPPSTSSEYSKAVSQVPNLDDQGDGIRSFVGLALVVLSLSPEAILLDEPESFLHPGQARAVGRWLAEIASTRDIQVFAATHDKDFLIGLLSAGRNDSLQVLRVARHSDGSSLIATTSDKLNRYWSDPVLRYSNVLQGLFHERVVVCEGDVDCRFYAAACEELATSVGRRQVADNTLFVPSSGKNGMPKLLGVLADLGVHASVVADFDILDSDATLKSILTSLGVPWDDALETIYSSAIKQIPSPAAEFWKKAKKAGLGAVPPGGATQAFAALIDSLRARRLHVVAVGELEDFYRPVGKGTEWLAAALTAGAHRNPDVQSLLAEVVRELRAESPTTPA